MQLDMFFDLVLLKHVVYTFEFFLHRNRAISPEPRGKKPRPKVDESRWAMVSEIYIFDISANGLLQKKPRDYGYDKLLLRLLMSLFCRSFHPAERQVITGDVFVVFFEVLKIKKRHESSDQAV